MLTTNGMLLVLWEISVLQKVCRDSLLSRPRKTSGSDGRVGIVILKQMSKYFSVIHRRDSIKFAKNLIW